MARKKGLKESTRRKGQLRVDQQRALAAQRSAKKKDAPKPKPKAKAKAKTKTKAKRKRVRTVGGLADLLRSRGRLE